MLKCIFRLPSTKKGYTIVEILVVIVVIGILAAISYISYNGVQSRAVVASLQSDLQSASDQLVMDQANNKLNNNSDNFAASASSLPKSSGTTYSYTVNNATTPKTFCLTATKSSNSYFITQEGLPMPGPCPVLYLDANITTSYPGTGTTWYDLSGNANNGTMYGAVPFETDVVPNFNFSTVTSSVPSGNVAYGALLGFTFITNMVTRTGDFTFSTWVKNPPSVSQLGMFSNAGGGDGYRFGVGLSGVYFLVGPPYTEGTINFLTPVQSNTWNNVVTVFQRSNSKVLVYLNGVYQNTANIPASQTIMVNTAPGIVRSSCCSLYTGKISSFSVYNAVLTSSEITQSFDILHSKYGL